MNEMRSAGGGWTPAQRRMLVLGIGAAFFGLVNSGFDVIAPLWAVGELGLDADGWAFLRSSRMVGTCTGILVLGVLAERLGSRLLASGALVGGGLALAALSAGWSPFAVMPVFGALISASFVNFNALTQRVSERRPGLANALYRAVGATMGVLAPVVATQLAAQWGAYAPVITLGGLLLGLGGLVILCYPDPSSAERRPGMAEVWAGYRAAFADRRLWLVIALDQGISAMTAAMGTFAALRFTRTLGLSEPGWGLLATCAGVVSIGAILATAWLVVRLDLARVLAIAWSGVALGALLLGLSPTLPLAMTGFVLYAALASTTSVPMSLWLSRLAPGGALATVFTVHKFFQAGTSAAAIAVVGALEPHLGMAALMWVGGVLAVPIVVATWCLRAPGAAR